MPDLSNAETPPIPLPCGFCGAPWVEFAYYDRAIKVDSIRITKFACHSSITIWPFQLDKEAKIHQSYGCLKRENEVFRSRLGAV